MSEPKLILLTNDDGIKSPGLWAAAEALQTLGEVMVAAPRRQSTAAGRSLPLHSRGSIHATKVRHQGRTWQAYGIEGSPAQVVQHALLELLPRRPDLIVSGINYGENVGTGVTISGTVGAALEGASVGISALAASLQVDKQYHVSHSDEVDFSAAAFFTCKFARMLLAAQRLVDVDVLKLEVPDSATPTTPWRVTRLSRTRYYEPLKPERAKLTDHAKVGYRRSLEKIALEPDSDVQALADRVVSITPLSLDMTSRIDLNGLAALLTQTEKLT